MISLGYCHTGSDWQALTWSPSWTTSGREEASRVSGPTHSWGVPSPGDRGAHASEGRPGRRRSHYTIALFRPGWSLRPQPKVVWVSRGAPPWGTPHGHQDLGGFLRGRARRQRCFPGWPPGESGWSPPLWLADNSMQEGEWQGRGPNPLLPGNNLPPSRCRRAPFPYERDRWRVFKRTLSFAGRSRASLQGGLRLDSVCLHGKP